MILLIGCIVYIQVSTTQFANVEMNGYLIKEEDHKGESWLVDFSEDMNARLDYKKWNTTTKWIPAFTCKEMKNVQNR